MKLLLLRKLRDEKEMDFKPFVELVENKRQIVKETNLENKDEMRIAEYQKLVKMHREYLLQASNCSESLFSIRREWDFFVVPKGQGSAVPNTPLTPNSNPNKAWEPFVSYSQKN